MNSTNDDPQRTGRTRWRFALIVPFVAAGLAWLWTDVTVSTAACARDDRGGVGVAAGLVILGLIAPIATAWQARRQRQRLVPTAALVIASALLAAALVWIAYLVWWFGHDCYS